MDKQCPHSIVKTKTACLISAGRLGGKNNAIPTLHRQR